MYFILIILDENKRWQTRACWLSCNSFHGNTHAQSPLYCLAEELMLLNYGVGEDS